MHANKNIKLSEEPSNKIIIELEALILKEEFNLFETKIKELLVSYPRSIILLRLLSSFLLNSKRYEDAMYLYDKLTKLDPNNDALFYNVAVCSICLNDVNKFHKYIEKLTNSKNEDLCFSLPLELFFKRLSVYKFKTVDEVKVCRKIMTDLLNFLLEKGFQNQNLIMSGFKIFFNSSNFYDSKINLKTESMKGLENSLLNDTFFINCLKRVFLSDAKVEKKLTDIRKQLLDLVLFNGTIQNQSFVYALSTQCFLNEYCYYVTKEEEKKLKTIIKTIDTKNFNELHLTILMSYFPVNNIIEDLSIFDNYHSFNDEFMKLLNLHIFEKKTEQNLKSTIPYLSKLENKVSNQVKSQYEENPYPRWISNEIKFLENNIFIEEVVNDDINCEILDRNTLTNNKDLLIAGCGTGQQVLYSYRYGSINVTAVDISQSSLAYAKRKSDELGFKNIKFLNSDILNLENYEKKFDVIECSGVLHHMENPIKGLDILHSLLKPGGYIKLGLYSSSARLFVQKMHHYINSKKYTDKPSDMREFRNDVISNKIQGINLKYFVSTLESYDFWNLSGLRDLFFHKHEKTYTIPGLKNIIKKCNFDFLGFVVEKETLDLYSKIFPNDIDRVNLDNWEGFENISPTTFRAMYQFWLKSNR